jgi:hypothetical protein
MDRCVHEVEVEGVERRGGFLHGGQGLGAVMHAADGLQVPVVEALHADGQARDARAAVGAEALLLEGAGVGLQRDFAARVEPQARADVGQQPVDGLGCEQAGRAAADEDAVHRAAPDEGQGGFEVGHQRVEVAGGGHVAARLVRVEVAVGALAQAPGDVHVQRQRRQAGQLQQAGAHVVLHVARRQGLRRRDDGDGHRGLKTIAACAWWPMVCT